MTDENTTDLLDPTAPPELDDDVLAAAGLQRTVAYVKTNKGRGRKKGSSAERMARKRERDAAAGIVTKALAVDDQEALELGKKVLGLKGWKKRIVLRWIG